MLPIVLAEFRRVDRTTVTTHYEQVIARIGGVPQLRSAIVRRSYDTGTIAVEYG